MEQKKIDRINESCQAREGAGADRRGEGRARGAAAGVCEFRARRPAKSAQQHLCDGRKGQQDQAHPVERGPQAEQVDPTFFAAAGAYAERGRTSAMEHLIFAAFYGGSATELYRTLGAHRTPDGWVFRVWAPHAGSSASWAISARGTPPRIRCAVSMAASGRRRPRAFRRMIPRGRRHRAERRGDLQGRPLRLPRRDASRHGEQAVRVRLRLGRRRVPCGKQPVYDRPLNIYEVHLARGGGAKTADFYDYRSLADELSEYAADLGYNCVELMPVTEYPLDDSWGYQCPATSRRPRATARRTTSCSRGHDAPKGHRRILDWVPAHFCKDEHGLIDFDGEPCYEYGRPKKARARRLGHARIRLRARRGPGNSCSRPPPTG